MIKNNNKFKINIPKTMNPDIAIERKNATIDPEEMSIWFWGGKGMLDMKRMLEIELYKDLEDPLEIEFLSYEEMCSRSIKNSVAETKKLKEIQQRINPGGSEAALVIALLPTHNPLTVHILLFAPALKTQGSPEIYERFAKRAENFEILGTYAQTELGHGTYMKGLESRADYDRETQEFVLNTPTLTSYKWWPGGMGHACNYCIFVARLYIDNEPKGNQMFVVQIRDEETHKPLPGVHVGEIGKKLGLNGLNNGFLGLKNYRVPRTHMLMKNQQVLPDGTFVKSPLSQLNYLPMVAVRCKIAIMNALILAQGATIVSRYSVIRRQSPLEEGQSEPKIFEHLTQQMKILPEIATAIAYFRAARSLYRMYEQTAKAIKNKDFSRLSELHALACTLKVSCSYDAANGLERLRQACGGHGFLMSARLGALVVYSSAACTYEGENTVLSLEVGKILMRIWADVLNGRKLMPTMAYLGEFNQVSFPKWSGSWECLLKALQYTCARTISLAYERYSKCQAEGQNQQISINNCGLVLIKASELHGRAFVAGNFFQEVTGEKFKSKRSPKFQKVLENLLELHLIQIFFRHMGDILRFIPLMESEISSLQLRLEEALKRLRPEAIALTDGFDFHDKLLQSSLGSYDGNVYERLFDSALRHPLNQKEVPDFFHEHLKPFMEEGKQKSKL